MASEWTPLVLTGPETDRNHEASYAKSQSSTLTKLLGSIQAVLLVLFMVGTTYSSDDYSADEYVIFRDVMVMLLLGFGFLMTFLRKYGLGAVGLSMMVSAIAIQLNVFVELFCRFMYGKAGSDDTVLPLPLNVAIFIDGEFAAATLLISFGAVIGRASPVQLVVMALCQSFAYAFNKVVLVFGLWAAEDVGGSMTIHMFGAFFGLAVSYVLGAPKPSTTSNASPNATSDVMALIGTTLLWVYWPSFVGATETGVPENEKYCVMHTMLALLGSTLASFYMSQKLCNGKLDPVHVANATLAGGVAVGSSARLTMTPGGALALGVTAGVVSVYGYVYSTPMLEKKYGVFDTCGVGNLHGWPGILGGFSSVVFVLLDSDAEFLSHGAFGQSIRQVMGVVTTVMVAVASGYGTGHLMIKTATQAPDEYDDAVWWEGEYFDESETKSRV